MAIDPRLQADLNKVINRLKELEPTLTKGPVRKILSDAAKPMLKAVKAATPKGKVVHNRYPRRTGAKAAKGAGKIVATYTPGNLKRAMSILKFRRSRAVFVGPALNRAKVDGYYAHMQEYGTQYQRENVGYFSRAVEATAQAVLADAVRRFKDEIEMWAIKQGFK